MHWMPGSKEQDSEATLRHCSSKLTWVAPSVSDDVPPADSDLTFANGPRADDSIPVSPGLEFERAAFLTSEHRVPEDYLPVDRRTVIISGLAVLIAAAAGLVARILVALIGLITNLA